MPKRRPKFWKTIGATFWLLFAAIFLLIGFATSSEDCACMHRFMSASDRWQVNPEFRAVAQEYCDLSADAMQTKPAGLTATRWLMTLRSLPGLSEDLAANPGSLTHYRNFTRGPLSAYLHLTGEQGVTMIIPMIEEMSRRPEFSETDAQNFLAGFKIRPPVVRDGGAVRSVMRLIDDVDGRHDFVYREPVGDRLRPHIESVARRLHIPPDVLAMTSDQQHDVLAMLDDEVKSSNYELWRTKQVNDFLSGVWAQPYSLTYSQVMKWVLRLRECSLIFGPVMFFAAVAWIVRRWRARREAKAIASLRFRPA